MNYWSNIEISLQDSELIEIDKFGKSLGELSEATLKVRELIRRFEVCHFKYKEHLKYINDSIHNLKPAIDPDSIGVNHVSKGKRALENDKTGRSLLGQQYLCSLKGWLGDGSQENSEYFNRELNQQIEKWLKDKNQDKERLVHLLVSRLMWDWSSYQQDQRDGENEALELQVCRMDICHYAFPKHLDSLLQGIGRMEPIDDFEGCGTFNSKTKNYIEAQFLTLSDYLKSNGSKIDTSSDEQIKFWLVASLAKTLKEQVGLKAVLPHFNG